MYTQREKAKYATYLRRHQTQAERKLWYLYLLGFKPQVVVYGYIVDWFNKHARLAIELDGSVHNSKAAKARDKSRTKHLNSKGILVIRFKNKSAMHYRFTTTFVIVAITTLRQLFVWFKLSP